MKKESYVLEFDDDTFTFSFNGERTPFELLVKNNEDAGKAKYLLAKELEEKKYKQEDIAPLIGYKNKGQVSKLLKRGKESGW